jgi:hypothetical protein
MDSELQRRYEVLWYQRQISAYLTGGSSPGGHAIAPSAAAGSAAVGSVPVDAEESAREGTAGTSASLVIASAPPTLTGFGSVFPGGAVPAVFIDASGAGTSSSSSQLTSAAGPATPSRPSGTSAASSSALAITSVLGLGVYSFPFLSVSPFPAVRPLDRPPRPSSAPPPSLALRDFWLDSSLCEASLRRYKSRWDNWCDFAASHRVSALPPD